MSLDDDSRKLGQTHGADDRLRTAEADCNQTGHGCTELWLVPLLLLVLCVLAYGLLIPWLGYYVDEWDLVWAVHSHGPLGVLGVYSYARPQEGWFLLPPTLLFGDRQLFWHFFALVVRWLSAVVLWFSLRSVWSRRTCETAAVAILFAIYPGFSQQSIPQIYWLTFAQLCLMFASWWLTVRALRKPGRGAWSHASAAVLLILALTPAEYYFGLELLRPILIWTVLGQTMPDTKLRLRRVLREWIPYLVILLAFVIWRLLFLNVAAVSSVYNAGTHLASFHAHPLRELLQRGYGAVSDLLKAGVFSWVQTLPLDKIRGGQFGTGTTGAVAWLTSVSIGLAAAAVAAVALRLLRRREPTEPTIPEDAGSWNRQALAIGFLAMCVGGLPFWFANLSITLSSGMDRCALPLMVGSCLVAAGVIRAVLRTRRLQLLAVLTLIALSVGFHVRTAELYGREWARMKSIAWQYAWRVPDFTPNSVFLMKRPSDGVVPVITGTYTEVFALIHGLTVHRSVLRDHPTVRDIQLFFDGMHGSRGIWPDTRLLDGDRVGSPSGVAVMWIGPKGTLWLLDSLRDEHPDLAPLARAVQPLSNLNAVVSPRTSGTPSAPPVDVFGTEPAHGWLYYFQKICLARQLDQWGWACELADSARQRSLKPEDSCEWLPFIETYLMMGRPADAESLVMIVARSRPEARSVLVGLLGRVKAQPTTSEDMRRAIDNMREGLNYEPRDP